jgi:D-alanyl-D-alanine carboxypeptidase
VGLVLGGVVLLSRLIPEESGPIITVAEDTPVAAEKIVATVAPPRPHFSYAWLEENPAPEFGSVTARAAFLVDLSANNVLYARNEHDQRAPASTTKILTAIIALETGDPAKGILVSERAGNAEPNVMGLQTGEVVPLETLLYGMMLDSGNDAAIAVAEGLLGYDAFVQAMNAKVQELGLLNTKLSNPTGYDEDTLPHYSSAHDLAALSKYALERTPGIIDYASVKRVEFTATDQHGWYGPINLNRLLWTYEGTYGLKPGWTPDAQYCLVAVAQRGGHNLLVVVLGSSQHFTDAAILLDYGFARLSG